MSLTLGSRKPTGCLLQCCCISQPQARPPSPLWLSLTAAGCCAGLGTAADWPPDATPSSRLGFRWADSCLDPTGKPLLHLGLAALQHCHEPCSLWHLLLVPCALRHLPSHRSLAQLTYLSAEHFWPTRGLQTAATLVPASHHVVTQNDFGSRWAPA